MPCISVPFCAFSVSFCVYAEFSAEDLPSAFIYRNMVETYSSTVVEQNSPAIFGYIAGNSGKFYPGIQNFLIYIDDKSLLRNLLASFWRKQICAREIVFKTMN